MKGKLLIAIALLTSPLFVPTVAPQTLVQRPAPARFSAEMLTMTGKKKVAMNGKLFYDAGRVRMDIVIRGEGTKGEQTDQSVIILPEQKLRYLIWHQQKAYTKVSTEDSTPGLFVPEPHAMPVDPCAGRPRVRCTRAGSEMVNGRLCDRWELAARNKRANTTSWIDQKTHWEIKSVRADGRVMELTHFSEGPQPDSLFTPPAGYIEVSKKAVVGVR